MADAATHMHEHGIMHGDFYAHNIMIDDEANSILGDFGGASYFEPSREEERNALERLEVRAFGCLIEEMLMLSSNDTDHTQKRKKLELLKDACLDMNNDKRPLFKAIYQELIDQNETIA